MSIFKSIHTNSEKAIEKGESFIKNSEEYFKLKVFYILTSSLSMIFNFAIIGIFLLIAFVFLAVTISATIGNYLNNVVLGYLLVALLFIIFALIAYSMRTNVENFVIKNLSKKYFDDEENL
ncbi:MULTISPECIES: phage holin family protein [Tenacibaculum]|uniref:Holin-X, holin superfamily III n=2 Tax=Tenacibaculum TaxID=104267 RepID=A0AAE9MMF3_9FLAO|nr:MULTISPECIES: phage holin family protein [Tenacibaculum]GFD73617.1 hypothetical protein KUL113_30370 [Tenacibaculum sp. KUL113]GFD81063.1 hypothetical protein KUL118_39250 [Tenacibaculum sp. KUL118]GFD95336.1 hypothetical protein KUL154_40690 [Alteromonas sp. KUL154]GFE02536.1 hypothetical protein KUL156_51280 [Alteromonas sp. KUL156]KAF9658465.1 hypothetical protein HBA12_14920 [Tenacibaculum mesophilum]